MSLLSLQEVRVAFGGPKVLDGVSVNVEEGDRACVTGRNGEGKSTLLKVMAGLLEPDEGSVVRAPGLRVAYLSQDVPSDEDGTAAEVVARAAAAAGGADATGGARFLTQLGIDGAARFDDLSGGQRRRVRLAAALASEPGLLLLDEPTNHLDVPTIEWLEAFLARARLACVFVTHDRAFLRRTARRVFDLDRGRLAGWDCDWETFLRRRAELDAEEERLWERKEKRLATEEQWLVHGVTARRARNVGRLEGLRRLREEIAGRRARIGTSRLSLGEAAGSGEIVAKLEGVTYAWPGAAEPVVRDFSATILRGERIALVGPNGAGKTTLARLLLGRLAPQAGTVRLGARVEASFFDQLRSTLDPAASVRENLAGDHEHVVVNGVRRHVFGYLQDFLFTPERARTPVSALSGGERARLLLARLFLAPGNLLVMDEPTNDLDVETLELLEEQLLGYKGTLVLVSHDRDFIDHVATSCFVLLGGGRVHVCPGGWSDWERERAALERGGALSAPRPAGAAAPAPRPPEPRPAAAKRPSRLGFNEKRELAALPGRIAALEGEVAAIESALADGTAYARDAKRAAADAARLPAAKAELDALVERWMELEERSSGG